MRVPMLSGRRTLLLAVLATGAAACAVVLGIDDRPLRRADVGDAASSTTTDPCGHVLPVAAPEKDDGQNDVAPFYLAVRTLSFVEKRNGLAPGFDLDGVCTCERRVGTAADGGSSCVAQQKDCDDDGGVDNRGAAIFESFADLVDIDKASNVDSLVARGKQAIHLHISDYNGTPNDREVRIGVMTSYGIVDGSGCGTVPQDDDGGTPKAPPGWCGRDKWTYSRALVVPQAKVPVLRFRGWVNNGRLAFRSDEVIKIFFGTTAVEFGSPVGSGKLEKNADGNWKLTDGVLAGRMLVTDLLRAMGALNEPREGSVVKRLCESVYFGALKDMVCVRADIARTTSSDFQAGACDSISSGMTFTAEQSDVGEELTEPESDNPCALARVDAGLYTCPKTGL